MSALKVVLHEQAQEEYDRAVEWYQQHRSEGVAESFMTSVDSALRRLQSGHATLSPTRQAPPRSKIWHMPAAEWHRLIVAELDEGYLVLAIAHHRSRPGYWLPRLVK